MIARNATAAVRLIPSSFTPLVMSAEFDDVLTNQPIVIDNVRFRTHAPSQLESARERVLTIVSRFASNRDLER